MITRCGKRILKRPGKRTAPNTSLLNRVPFGTTDYKQTVIQRTVLRKRAAEQKNQEAICQPHLAVQNCLLSQLSLKNVRQQFSGIGGVDLAVSVRIHICLLLQRVVQDTE